MPVSILEIINVRKSFGEQKVLNGLDISIEKGKIYTVVGGNGTGKTTLFNLITGFLKPDKGEIWYNHKRIDKGSPVRINAKGITRTFQDLRIINQLSVKENLLLSFKRNPGEEILNSILPSKVFNKNYERFSEEADQILEKVHLAGEKNSLAGEISYGQQKLLTIGCCLANDAQLLLLDEPVAGIDKNNYERIYKLVKELRNEGKTIIQIEHNHEFIKGLSDEILFLNEGLALNFSTFSSFIKDPVVQKSYLN